MICAAIMTAAAFITYHVTHREIDGPVPDNSGLVAARDSFDFLRRAKFGSFEVFRNEQTPENRDAYPDRYYSGFHQSHRSGSSDVRIEHLGSIENGAQTTKILLKFRGDDRPKNRELYEVLSLVLSAHGLKSAESDIVAALWPNGVPDPKQGVAANEKRVQGEVERLGLWGVSVRQIEIEDRLEFGSTDVEVWGKLPAERMFNAMKLSPSEQGKLHVTTAPSK